MSGYTNFAVVGAGTLGNYIVQQLLKDKAVGTVKEVVVLTRQVKYLSINQDMRDMTDFTHWTLRVPRLQFKETPR
jgi:pyrroline-5-carboxylate reductase